MKEKNWFILSGEIICVDAENHMQVTNTHVDKTHSIFLLRQGIQRGIIATATVF